MTTRLGLSTRFREPIRTGVTADPAGEPFTRGAESHGLHFFPKTSRVIRIAFPKPSPLPLILDWNRRPTDRIPVGPRRNCGQEELGMHHVPLRWLPAVLLIILGVIGIIGIVDALAK